MTATVEFETARRQTGPGFTVYALYTHVIALTSNAGQHGCLDPASTSAIRASPQIVTTPTDKTTTTVATQDVGHDMHDMP